MRLARLWATVIGCGFLVVGVLRFVRLEGVPGWDVPEPVHGLLHLVSGALWLAAAWAYRGRYVGPVNRWLGLFWLVIGVVGNLGMLERVEALSFDDNGVHLVVGVVGTAVGWAGWVTRRVGRPSAR